jgi:hypothetical protein
MEVKDLYDDNGKPLPESSKILDDYLNAHHERFHNILQWASVAIIINFLFIVIRLHNLHSGDDERKIYFTALLVFFVLAFALFLYVVWRSDTTLGPENWPLAKVLLQYKIEVMNKQVQMLMGYLIAYSIALGTAYLFYKTTGLVKAEKVLSSTSSVSLMMYGLGAYSLKICLTRRYKLTRERDTWPC